MKKIYSASALFTSLLIFSGVLVIMFLFKDNILYINESMQNHYQRYLNDKHQLITEIHKNSSQLDAECNRYKKELIKIDYKVVKYQFSCQTKSIFVRGKPKQAYIRINDILQWIHLDHFRDRIYFISSLTELPESSRSDPKVVIMLGEVNEKLNKKFYGLIITEHSFNVSGKKIYGALFSTTQAKISDGFITYNESVINEIERQFSYWAYLPYSRNLLANE